MSYDLAIRLPNWVGDTVMALPAIQALNQLGLRLALIGKPWGQALLEGLAIDYFCYPKGFKARVEFWKAFDTKAVLLLPSSFSSAAEPFLAGKKNIGFNINGRQLLRIFGQAKPQALHEVEYYYLLSKLACTYLERKLSLPLTGHLSLPIPSSNSLKAEHLIEKNKLQHFFILCPLAFGKFKGKSKVWPHWQALIAYLTQQQIQVVICPGPEEELFCRNNYSSAIILEKVDLGLYAALCAKAKMIIANDSGPMHIATATNHNTLGILSVTEPTLTRPWGGHYLYKKNQWPDLKEVISALKHNFNLTL